MNRNPATGASVIVFEDGKVLLIKRGKEPFKGYWSLPGGSHEYGETLEECAARELREETGLDAGKLEFCRVRDRITRDEEGNVVFHYVLATYRALDISGTPKAMDDAMDIGWFTHQQLSCLKTTTGTPEFLEEVLGEEFVQPF